MRKTKDDVKIKRAALKKAVFLAVAAIFAPTVLKKADSNICWILAVAGLQVADLL